MPAMPAGPVVPVGWASPAPLAFSEPALSVLSAAPAPAARSLFILLGALAAPSLPICCSRR